MTHFEKEVIERLGRIEEQNTTQFKRLEALEKAINGNGTPGLLTRVAGLEVNWRWAKWVCGAIGTGIGILVSHIIKR